MMDITVALFALLVRLEELLRFVVLALLVVALIKYIRKS